MHDHLLIPGLFWPPPADPAIYRDLRLPALETLLGRSAETETHGSSVEAWLCGAFGVARQQDWPVAALTLEADGTDPGDGYWLRADPVHLEAKRDHLRLVDPSVFPLTEAEAAGLVEALNRHFAQDGLAFLAPDPRRWYLRAATAPDLRTVSVGEAAGRDVDPLLPSGTGALAWRRLLNEIQMLLHGHPLNDEREARGEPPLNSVWLWGGGVRAEVPRRPWEQVAADDALAHALARRSGAGASPLPADARAWLGSGRGGPALLILEGLARAVRYGDAWAWRESLAALDQAWFAPLLAALERRELRSLTLVVPAPDRTREFRVAATDLWKLWRRVRPLALHA